MKKPNLAVLGATGVVGREILSILEEQKVEFNDIKLLSSKRSAGSKLQFAGKEYTVLEATPEVFEGVNIVLASAGLPQAKFWLQKPLKEERFLLIIQAHFVWKKMCLLL